MTRLSAAIAAKNISSSGGLARRNSSPQFHTNHQDLVEPFWRGNTATAGVHSTRAPCASPKFIAAAHCMCIFTGASGILRATSRKGLTTRSSANENGCCLPSMARVRQPKSGPNAAHAAAEFRQTKTERGMRVERTNWALARMRGIYHDRAGSGAVCRARYDRRHIVQCGLPDRYYPLILRFFMQSAFPNR